MHLQVQYCIKVQYNKEMKEESGLKIRGFAHSIIVHVAMNCCVNQHWNRSPHFISSDMRTGGYGMKGNLDMHSTVLVQDNRGEDLRLSS